MLVLGLNLGNRGFRVCVFSVFSYFLVNLYINIDLLIKFMN